MHYVIFGDLATSRIAERHGLHIHRVSLGPNVDYAAGFYVGAHTFGNFSDRFSTEIVVIGAGGFPVLPSTYYDNYHCLCTPSPYGSDADVSRQHQDCTKSEKNLNHVTLRIRPDAQPVKFHYSLKFIEGIRYARYLLGYRDDVHITENGVHVGIVSEQNFAEDFDDWNSFGSHRIDLRSCMSNGQLVATPLIAPSFSAFMDPDETCLSSSVAKLFVNVENEQFTVQMECDGYFTRWVLLSEISEIIQNLAACYPLYRNCTHIEEVTVHTYHDGVKLDVPIVGLSF